MSVSFADLGLARDLAAHLEAKGITEPTTIQAATLADLIAGRDLCAAALTQHLAACRAFPPATTDLRRDCSPAIKRRAA